MLDRSEIEQRPEVDDQNRRKALQAGEILASAMTLLAEAEAGLRRHAPEHAATTDRVWNALAKALGHLRTAFPQAGVETALEQLLAADDWHHPSHVLDSPHPDTRELLSACDRRLETAAFDARQRLFATRNKLDRIARIEETARRRRNRELDAILAETAARQSPAQLTEMAGGSA